MDRISAARERVEANRLLAIEAREAGPPCSECRHKTLLGNCGNPAYSEFSYDAAKGAVSERFDVPVTKARSANGLCGPEAILFEVLTVPAEAMKAAWIGAKTVWFGAVALVFLIFLLSK